MGCSYLEDKGQVQKEITESFPSRKIQQEAIVETVNSVEKRKFGDDLRSRLLKTQRREIKVVDIVYNIYRYINYVVSTVIGFLQSHFFCNLRVLQYIVPVS